MTESDRTGPYHVVDPAAIDRTPDYPCERHSVTEALGLSMLALASYTLDPGDQLPRSYHSHERREECFHVTEGRLFVETPAGTFEVPAGQLFVVEPGNPHRAYNPADAPGPVEVLGIGAPQYDPAERYEP